MTPLGALVFFGALAAAFTALGERGQAIVAAIPAVAIAVFVVRVAGKRRRQ